MKLIKSKNCNVNYLAKVVDIKVFRKHSNPEVTKLKCCTIDGFNIITSIDAEPGLYIYFPTACCINPDFLSYNNLFRKSEKNNDPHKTGLFEDNGRVKAVKLKGELSEGFIVPAVEFTNWLISITNRDIELIDGTEFDTVEHEGKTFWVNKKFIVKRTQGTPGGGSKKTRKVKKELDKVIPSQFRFHYDTVIIKKCPNVIQPEDLISITEKIHGMSHISAYVMCHKELTWKEKLAKWLTGNIFDIYDHLYASKNVIKNQYYNPNVTPGFYGCDTWKYADDYLRPYLQKGMTIYAEIVGYNPTGTYIQKGYDYGCEQPNVIVDNLVYEPEKHFKVRPYRITLTNVDGEVHEFSAREVQQYCKAVGLTPVTEYYYGYAKDLYPELDSRDENWANKFLDKLSNDKRFYMECKSPSCVNKVPHEGIVIKKEDMIGHAWKLKCFKFVDKAQSDPEMDKEDELD